MFLTRAPFTHGSLGAHSFTKSLMKGFQYHGILSVRACKRNRSFVLIPYTPRVFALVEVIERISELGIRPIFKRKALEHTALVLQPLHIALHP